MTTIIKTPKNPIQILRPDRRQAIIDALAKLVEKRGHLGDVSSQIGFNWVPGGRHPWSESRMPGFPGRHYADMRTAIDEHDAADHALRKAIDAYLDAEAPTRMRKPLVAPPLQKPVPAPLPVPAPVASATEPARRVTAAEQLGHQAAETTRLAYPPSPLKPRLGPTDAGLWPRGALGWLHAITRPLKPGADPVKLGGWMSRRFFLGGNSMLVGATNGHVMTVVRIASSLADNWLPRPGTHEPPRVLDGDHVKVVLTTLNAPMDFTCKTISVAQLHAWAGDPIAREADACEDIAPGTIMDVPVNRKQVALATWGLPGHFKLAVRVNARDRMVRIVGPNNEQAMIMGLGTNEANAVPLVFP